MTTFHRIFGALTGLLVAVVLVVSASAFLMPPRHFGHDNNIVAAEQTMRPSPHSTMAPGATPGEPG